MRCRGPSAITTQAPLARGRARTLCFTISSLRGRDTKIVRASNIKTLPLCPMERAQAGGTNRDSCRRGEFPLRATTGHTTTTCWQGALRFCWNCFPWRACCRHRRLRRHRLSRQTPHRLPAFLTLALVTRLVRVSEGVLASSVRAAGARGRVMVAAASVGVTTETTAAVGALESEPEPALPPDPAPDPELASKSTSPDAPRRQMLSYCCAIRSGWGQW